FTLLEMLIALTIGSVVLGLIANAYLGANKAQSMTVANGLMKSSGQSALNTIYGDLHQASVFFDRGVIADSFLSRLPIAGYDTSAGALSPGVDQTDVLLPLLTEKASFWEADATGTINPDFSPGAVGNALFFATAEAKAIMAPEFGQGEYHLTPYRLHFYFLARRAMAVNAHPIRPGTTFTYHLMHWESQPYLDYHEVLNFLGRYKDGGVSNADLTTKLDRLRPAVGPFAGAINLSAVDASLGGSSGVLYDLVLDDAGGRSLRLNTTARFATGRFHSAERYAMRESFGQTMVAFNTKPSSPAPSVPPAVPVAGLDVPAFASVTDGTPYGLEVMVGGEQSHRQVLLRLALAARTMPGHVMVGQTFQQVVQIFASAPKNATPGPTPTPVPTPEPDG
ncbi:MAG: PilW family protein, partial [Candidatus Sericytochromatia bacterium]